MGSTEKLNLTQKLLYIQQNLKAPKNQRNKFGDFNYRSCEDILEAVKPLLAETKTVLLISDDIQVKGDRFYVVATAVLIDTESGETIKNPACAREADSKPKMDAAQLTGSSSSYARKYALNGLFCIDDSRDPDMMEPEGKGSKQAVERNGKNQQQAPPENRGGTEANAGSGEKSGSRQNGPAGTADSTGTRPKYVGADCISNILAEMERTGITEYTLCKNYHIRSLDEATIEQYEDIMYKFSCTASRDQKAAG